MLNIIEETVKPLLLNLVNVMIKSKKFPKCKKISKILPNRKKNKDATDPEGLRPINIISVISKIIEKTISKQIIRYLIENKLISQSIQGSVPGRSSTMTLTEINEQSIEILSNKMVGAIIAMDQSAAFDVINHEILSKKLNHIGISYSATKLIIDYLSNRKQFTEINSNRSETTNCLNRGVFQGSILSGLMFLIYTLDINTIVHDKNHINNISEKNAQNLKQQTM